MRMPPLLLRRPSFCQLCQSCWRMVPKRWSTLKSSSRRSSSSRQPVNWLSRSTRMLTSFPEERLFNVLKCTVARPCATVSIKLRVAATSLWQLLVVWRMSSTARRWGDSHGKKCLREAHSGMAVCVAMKRKCPASSNPLPQPQTETCSHNRLHKSQVDLCCTRCRNCAFVKASHNFSTPSHQLLQVERTVSWNTTAILPNAPSCSVQPAPAMISWAWVI